MATISFYYDEPKPRFPAPSRYLSAHYARLGRARLPLCPACGKVRLMQKRFRAAGRCARCLTMEARRARVGA